MPYFSKSITTEKKGDEGDVKAIKLLLAPGVIHRVDVRIPPGCAGLLHCHVNHGKHQISPTRDGDWHGDDERISYKEHYDLAGGPYELTIHTWNEDEKYQHEIIVGFGVLSSWVLLPLTVANKINNAFKALIGKEQ